MAFSCNQQSRTFPNGFSSDFSGNEHFRSLPGLDNDIELDSFTDVAIDESIESNATKSKLKTEVENEYPLTNCNCSY